MYREAWQALIKPERCTFARHSLKPPSVVLSRTAVDQFEVRNADGLRLEGTFYYPQHTPTNKLDVVVYLHTRGGNRLEGLFLVPILSSKAGVVLFDFAGSGYSEGEYITLGPKEARDAGAVIDFMKQTYGVNRVLLWGRSMGAVAAILFAQANNDKISGLILDSPFSCFRRMIYDIVYSKRSVPTCLIDLVMHFVLKTVKRKTGVNMYSIKPINCVQHITVPCFYMVSHEDLISRPDKVKDLYLKTAATTKEFYLTQGEHNSARNKEAILKAMYFALRCFGTTKPQPEKGASRVPFPARLADSLNPPNPRFEELRPLLEPDSSCLEKQPLQALNETHRMD